MWASNKRPQVAAVAATTATNQGCRSGYAKPNIDIAIQVGGANAGMTFSTNTNRKSRVSDVTFKSLSDRLAARSVNLHLFRTVADAHEYLKLNAAAFMLNLDLDGFAL